MAKLVISPTAKFFMQSGFNVQMCKTIEPQ